MRALVALCVLCRLAGAAPPDAELRKIDWCNWSYANDRTYPALISCTATVDERHSEHGGVWAFLEYRFVSVAYGDLTGDGGEDALLALEVTQRPVLLSAGAPTTSAEFWLIQRRPDGIVIYTSESADAVPTRMTISKGIATLQWRVHGKVCEERWQFKREGEAAVKTPRACK
ncbi:MAG TPA: hypothetical protein VLX92_20525 [Kofleriaceae bacterium]|nr:hypothetical protein [Kofleriaceae bacterium]